VVRGVNDLVKKVAILLKNKYGTIRNASRELGINEGNLYHNWVNEGRRGNIHLKELLRLCKETNVPTAQVAKSIKFFSQRAGHRIKLPVRLSKDMLYFAGLIAGDGSICKTNFGGYAIRFSNSNAFLMKRFAELSKSLFDVEAGIMEGNEKRPTDGRFHSKLVGEILNNLGVSFSPKSDKIDLSNLITKLPNSHLSAFLRGLFDCDGSISLREKGGSSVEFYTTSEKFIKKLQIVLSRFGIISKLRRRKKVREVAERKDGKKIESKHDVLVLSVYGSEFLQLFKKHIGFSHPEKNAQLEAILNKSYHSNWDFVPKVGQILKQIRETFGINALRVGISNAFEHEKYNPTRNNLQNLVNGLAKKIEEGKYEGKRIIISQDLKNKIKNAIEESKAKDIAAHLQISMDRAREYFYRPDRKNKIPFLVAEKFCDLLTKKGYESLSKEIKEFADFDLLHYQIEESRKSLELLQKLSRSKIFWDEIKEIKEIESNSDYIYDLTVENSHNFIANGVLVHNTAAAVKDEFGEGRWSLEAGSLVLADMGIACIDELDKISQEERSALHQAMEQQEISIAKAGINTTLKSRCALLGAANPKFGRFDESQPLPEQIDMPPTLISRFDLIFPIIDKPNKEADEKLAQHLLEVHKFGEQGAKKGEVAEFESSLMEEIMPKIDPQLLRKYIAWAKRSIIPVLTEEAKEDIKNYFLELRGASAESIKCTPRQLEALIRLAESSAKARLSTNVELSDAERAKAIMGYFLQNVGFDRETGRIDIDIISVGRSRVQQTNMQKLMGIIKDLVEKSPEGTALKSEIISEGELAGIPAQKTEELLQSLRKQGLIYEPRPEKYDLVRK
jgi:replicative DNA helicase Mcm